ncbi:hypothetical protein BP6252_10786 [Coleophoma cylindrospora]|uniref:Zn(2)-C6 fungal-type domain-containing protein n=1 Tax=Coleophoma cylindrospora TaxID=1849047 RepID=A0A3D8QTM6_9HELO|nr:hypothetical protein BP6252_10786 [Coleophoma cylindrospora]
MVMQLMYWLVRRVKCDEGTPSCYACVSTGRKCDGYESNTDLALGLPSASLGPRSRSPFVGLLGSEQEHRSFLFFQQKSAPQLSGFLGGEFWETLLLQVALYEPSIRYAILALGSLHETLEQHNDLTMQTHADRRIDDFSLRNYNQAIKSLVVPFSRKGQQSIDVCLISSILFACLETMQGRYGPAIVHVQSGMKILCEVKYDEKTRRHEHNALGVSNIPYVSMEFLEELFMRLDLQVTQMVGGQKWVIYDSMKKYEWTRKIPAIFSSLSEARDTLASQWHVASYSPRHIWNPTSEKLPAVPQAGTWQKKSMSILARWSSAYDAYLNIRGDNMTDTKRKGTASLYILKELGSMSKKLTGTTVDDERNWDVFCPMFQKIVSLAEDIVELDLKSTAVEPQFCIDMAIIRPLFKVSCRCRDPIIRRRAISILQNCGRTEGEWDAFLTSKVAQRVLDIEEFGLQDVRSCDDVPDWARISNVFTVVEPFRRRATLTYSRLETKYDLTRQTKIEVIEW